MRLIPIPSHPVGRLALRVAGAGLLTGVGVTAYAACEARSYTLRRIEVPLLPPGADPLRVLHLSDLHMLPGQRRKQEWVSSLSRLPAHERPALVVNTGDNLSHALSVPVVRDALGPLLDLPGVYVLGSNDYFSPSMRNPFRYLLPDDGRRHTDVPQLPWPELKRTFDGSGWVDLTNRRTELEVRGLRFAFAGVDDPHLGYDRLEEVAGPPRPADVALGVAHAPYLRVLDQFASDGYAAVLAGHTHGGQICVPGVGALATNCDLDPARAKGLHRHPADSRPGDPGSAWLHVSGGLGTNPYVRVRIACRPEATLLTLVPTATAAASPDR